MQNAMLSKALGSGSDKGVFVLPKGKPFAAVDIIASDI